MQFGLHLGIRGPAADPDTLRIIACEAEALGFAHLGFSDHVVIANQVDSPYPYSKDGRWFAEDSGECLEQVTTLGFVAATTTRIRLLTSVMVLPHRPVVLAAKMLNTVDVLSKGRLTVGVGVGWMAEEIALLNGPPFETRGASADEYIEAFRTLWTDDKPRFHGEHVQFDGLKFFPKSAQSPHPPLWIGGEAKPGRRRAGRIGDGWYPVGNNPKSPFDTPERYAAGLADVNAAAEAAGRDPSDIAQGLYVIWYKLGEAEATPEGHRRSFTGSAEDILEDIGAYHDAGLEHLVIGGESGDLEQCLDRMRRFESDIMRRVR
jgi:probable F420-dependent oxidoreductase